MNYKAVTGLACLLLAAAGNNALSAELLRYNPFEQPDMETGHAQKDEYKTPGAIMILRGTVIDGMDSLVNIDGQLYRLNQEVSGYRITGIKSTSVTLRRGNSETILTLNNDK